MIVLLICGSIVLCNAAARLVKAEAIPVNHVAKEETDQPSVAPWGDPTPSEKPTDPETTTNTEYESVKEPEKEPEQEAEMDPDTQSEPQSKPASEVAPEPEGETDPDGEPETESVKEPETDTQPDSTSESDQESGSETKSESETDEKDQKKDDQKVIYEYDEYGEIIGKTVNGIWYIWDDDYGYQEGVRVNADRVVDPDAVTERKAGIQMTSILQLPDLPTGCEIVSTYMVLKYLQFPISLLKFTDQYFANDSNSADFRHYFVGDPYTSYGLGCYAPCIVSAVNSYTSDCGSDYLAYNYTGYTFEALLNQVAEGYPVIFWGTQYMKEPFRGTYFQVGDETIRWISQEHCMVLTGYDLDKNLATVYDPLVGIVQYDMNKLKSRFLQLGSQAVIIKKADVGYDRQNKPGAFLYDPNLPKQ